MIGTPPRSKRQQPPTAIPMPAWTTDKSAQVPSVFQGSFFSNDSSDNLDPVSPGYNPRGAMGFPGDGEDRRPSIASATTVSSTGSKSSVGGRVHKKLQGFFGDDVVLPGVINDTSRQNSEASSVQNGVPSALTPLGHMKNRNNSLTEAMMRSGPPSPSISRPRSPNPQPASEVTPWVFQDPDVCDKFANLKALRVSMFWQWPLTDLPRRTRRLSPSFRLTPATANPLNPQLHPDSTCQDTDTTEVTMKGNQSVPAFHCDPRQAESNRLAACDERPGLIGIQRSI
jgi:hypothetical protein